MVGGVCSMLPHGTGTCLYGDIYTVFNFLLFLLIFFLYFKKKKKLVLINQQNGPHYQCVPVLHAFLTGRVLKALT